MRRGCATLELLAARAPGVDWRWLVLAVAGIVLAHIANNLMNDLFDTQTGTDSATYPRALYAPHPVLGGLVSRRTLVVAILAVNLVDLAILIVALSMLVTPALFDISERLAMPRFASREERPHEPIDGPPAPVIICGFGRVGQVVGRVLRMQRIRFTALDKDAGQVEVTFDGEAVAVAECLLPDGQGLAAQSLGLLEPALILVRQRQERHAGQRIWMLQAKHPLSSLHHLHKQLLSLLTPSLIPVGQCKNGPSTYLCTVILCSNNWAFLINT